VDIVEIGLLALAVVLVIGGGGVAIAVARPAGLDFGRLVDEGLLAPQQAEELRAHAAASIAEERRQRAARAIGILGAAALGAGIILFFAANWSEIARPLRVAILLAGLVLFYTAGFWLLDVRRAFRNVGHGFVFVGAILFGASLFLVGQMYNVEAHDPLGFAIWSAGALATTLFFRSKPTGGLAVLTLEAWIIHELVEYDANYDAVVFIPYALALYGLALYGIGRAGGRRLDDYGLAGAMRVVGFALAGFMTLLLSFRYFYATEGDRPDGLPLWIMLASAAFAFLGAAALLVRQVRRPSWLTFEGAVVAVAAALVLLAVFAPEKPAREDIFDFDANTYPLLFAALLPIVVAGAIVLGSRLDETWLLSAGVSLGGLAIILHFLDITWDRLPRSFVFLLVGALALALAAGLEGFRRVRPEVRG
jgi:uncharacterized membrane protein